VTPASPAIDRLASPLWIAVGIGLLADAYLPLARAGFFVQSPAGLLWPAFAAVGLASITATAVRALDHQDRVTRLLLAMAILWSAALVVLGLTPPIARDELTHHLAMPLWYARAGRVIEIPFADQAYYPMLLEMLYTPLVAHGWVNAAKYLHGAFGVAACALILLYLQPRNGTRAALLAAVLMLTTPTVTALATSAYVDLGLLFFATTGLLGLLRWTETHRWTDLVVGALGAGCAASTKYNGLLVILLLGAAVPLLSPRRHLPAALGAALVFACVSTIALLPWLLKNLSETGNPFFPLFNGFFGGRPLPPSPAIDVFTKRHVLYGESWIEILLTPIRVFVTGRDGDPTRFDGVFNPLYLLGAAAACWPAAARRDRFLAGFAGALLLLVFFLISFRSRYAVAVLAPLALLTVETLSRWMAVHRVWRRALGVLIGAAFAFNAAHLGLLWAHVDPLAYLSGRQPPPDYIARFVPEYPVTAYANANLAADATVYLAFLGSRGYYWERPYTYDTYFSGTTLAAAIESASDDDEVATALRRKGISHIASADTLLARFLGDNLTPEQYERWLRFVRHHLRPVYGHEGVSLYEIV